MKAQAVVAETWSTIAAVQASPSEQQRPTWQPKPQPTMASMRAAIEHLRANIPGHDDAFAAAAAIAAGHLP